MHILIIEDSKAEAEIFAQTLKRVMDGPVQTYHAATLHDGLLLLQDGYNSFDLVFLDLKLSDSPRWQDTYEAVEPYTRKLPVIVMSGNDDSIVAQEIIKKGAEDYIVKGGKKRHVDMLKETIEFALCRREAAKKRAGETEQCLIGSPAITR